MIPSFRVKLIYIMLQDIRKLFRGGFVKKYERTHVGRTSQFLILSKSLNRLQWTIKTTTLGQHDFTLKLMGLIMKQIQRMPSIGA